MSAFIVDDKTINRVVAWMHDAVKRQTDFSWSVRTLQKLGYKLDTELGCKRLAEEMFTLNCDSIEQRYGEGQAKEFRPLDFQFSLVRPPGHYQALSSMRCLLYQCCEGDVPEQSDLYNALDRVSLELSYQLISRSKAYEAVTWD
jgi:hypothetical protein